MYFRLSAPITGRPAPTVSWGRTNNGLRARAIIDSTDSMTTLIIENADRDDASMCPYTNVVSASF